MLILAHSLCPQSVWDFFPVDSYSVLLTVSVCEFFIRKYTVLIFVVHGSFSVNCCIALTVLVYSMLTQPAKMSFSLTEL